MDTLINTLNDHLPQTQCEQCGYKGCLPYATALAKGEAAINLCVPGGTPTRLALAKKLNKAPLQDIKPEKPAIVRTVVIRESECIGCTKCLQVCPTDAIVGAPKHMHTIIEANCTGCELCLPLCPTNCMEVLDSAPEQPSWTINNPIQHAVAKHFQTRHTNRKQRLARQETQKKIKDEEKQSKKIKLEILACLDRVKVKKHDSLQNQQNFSDL